MTAAGLDRASVKARLAAVLAWSVAAVSLAGFAAAWTLAARNRDLGDLASGFGPDRFLVAYAVAGAVVASRRPANPIGWFLLGAGLLVACRALVGEYAVHALAGPARPTVGVWAAWFLNWSLTLLYPSGVLMFLLLLFPSGRPLTRRWWAVGWLGAGLGALYLLDAWFYPGAVQVSGLPSVPNPTGVRGWVHLNPGSVSGFVAWALGGMCLVAAAVSVFLRYRRSAGEERLQLKWFAWAAVLSLALLAALLPASILTETGQVLYDVAVVAGIGLALPVAIDIAILKYRLYAIDRVISRTVSYAVVTGLVAAVYLGCVVLLTRVLPLRGSVGIAAAVLAAAALFNPLRRRVQAVVDRHFDRARYDAERVVTRFSEQLRDQVDLEVLGADLLGVVNQVLAPEHLALWLNDTAGTPAAPAGSSGRRADGERTAAQID